MNSILHWTWYLAGGVAITALLVCLPTAAIFSGGGDAVSTPPREWNPTIKYGGSEQYALPSVNENLLEQKEKDIAMEMKEKARKEEEVERTPVRSR